MQLLVFNSTEKFAILYRDESRIEEIAKFQGVPTVKILEGFYEVIQRDESDKNYPVLRVPISNTNMLINR